MRCQSETDKLNQFNWLIRNSRLGWHQWSTFTILHQCSSCNNQVDFFSEQRYEIIRLDKNESLSFYWTEFSREKSFVKLTCRFRPKKIGYYSENVVLTVRRRNYFKTAITLTGRCVVNNLSANVNETIEHDENTKSTIFWFDYSKLINKYFLELIRNLNSLFLLPCYSDPNRK